MKIPAEQHLFLHATIVSVHANSERFFDFFINGERRHCFCTGTAPGLRELRQGQHVVMRGRWSRAVLQVFEADEISVLRTAPAYPAFPQPLTAAVLAAAVAVTATAVPGAAPAAVAPRGSAEPECQPA